MTIYIPSGATTARISFNTPNLSGNDYYFAIQSQYAKEYWAWSLTPITSNDRYSEFEITITEEERAEHINAIYNYELQLVEGTVQTIIETGLVKYITEEGGATGTTPYIAPSAEENREATAYYRPQY